MFRKFLIITGISIASMAQAQTSNTEKLDDSGVTAGFLDSSEGNTINFSTFHLPPLAVLFENAKENPNILALAKAEQLAKAEVSHQKKHIFSYLSAHASYSYGMFDTYSSQTSQLMPGLIVQNNGVKQSYWNIGASLNLPLEDILDLGGAVKRKRLEAERAMYDKDIAYEELKQRIATLYVQITNDLVTLKTAGENAAIYQGAGRLNEDMFRNGNLSIKDLAETKRFEHDAVNNYQMIQTQVTTNILILEILTHTPIITNSTTEVNIESNDYSRNKK